MCKIFVHINFDSATLVDHRHLGASGAGSCAPLILENLNKMTLSGQLIRSNSSDFNET